MNFWANMLGYQLVWLCTVIGAAHGQALPGVVGALFFAIWQLTVSRQRGVELRLMLVALVLGLLLDGSLARSGWLGYAAPAPAWPPGGAPVWILALWLAFALTLTQSLAFLQARRWLAALFGAIGGPLAYAGAAHGWAAVSFAPPAWRALLALALGWGVAMVLLAGLARRWSQGTRATPVESRP
jgi:hypothetical protein